MRNSLSVKQLNNYIKNVFEDELVLQNITVTGEVFQISYSKYTFITLKEDDCVMQCVCFAHMSMPKVGQKAAFFGSVTTGQNRCGRAEKMDSSTTFGSMRIIRTSLGADLKIKLNMMQLMHTDLPEPV